MTGTRDYVDTLSYTDLGQPLEYTIGSSLSQPGSPTPTTSRPGG